MEDVCGVATGGGSIGTRKRQHCVKCGRQHPTLLHDNTFSHRNDDKTTLKGTQTSAVSLHVTSCNTAEQSRCTHTMVVPVHLKHKDFPARRSCVCAA